MKKVFLSFLFVAAGCTFAQEPVAIKPGPDEGGMLPESVQNEVDVAIDRGINWLAAQQAEDGSFGEANKLFYTLVIGVMLEKRKMTEPADRAAKWAFEQQAKDGSFGEVGRFFYTGMGTAWLYMRGMKEEAERAKKWLEDYFFEGKGRRENEKEELDNEAYATGFIDPLFLVDKTDVRWRENLAKQRLAMQRANGGKGYWSGQNVPELKFEKGRITVGNPKVLVQIAENRGGPGGFTFPRAVLNKDSPLSDFEATLFVLMQLIEL